MIHAKTQEQIAGMRRAGAIVGDTLRMLRGMARPGVRLRALNKAAERFIVDRGATPTFKGYHGFPAALCLSVNDEVVHGLPRWRKLRAGDLLSIDCGATLDGWVGDSAITLPIGEVSPAQERLLDATRRALRAGLEAAQPGATIGDVGAAIEAVADAADLRVVREYCGHGIGSQMHEDPQVPNYGDPGSGPRIEEGWCLALEPILTPGDGRVVTRSDGWTVATRDGSDAAHFELVIACGPEGGQLLTLTSDGEWP